MSNSESMLKVMVVWRGNKYIVEMNADASVKDLGNELQKLTDVKADTMRLIIPQFSNKSSKMLFPFSDEHSQLSLQEASITEGKSIRMMGVSEDEVQKVLQNSKADLRIAGFDEEEKRMRQRMSDRPHAWVKLPQGPYIFCDFCTLQIPGLELNPPASEALKRMHMLAADPGIVAIMNKHRWRVGIMTEMAPVGYVGVSPKCILGFNKNHGEEISLRLRTDDLKGFRKYESIKKTLLHELAHMVYSEHDANFYALDKQLNEEAARLDWTKSRGHTLSGVSHLDYYEEVFDVTDTKSSSRKIGGNELDQLASARASSVAAAYRRLADPSSNGFAASELHDEPDPDDSTFNVYKELDAMDYTENATVDIESPHRTQGKPHHQLNSDEISCNQNKDEPDPDDSQADHGRIQPKTIDEPDPDDLEAKQRIWEDEGRRPNQNDSRLTEIIEKQPYLNEGYKEPDPDDSEANQIVQAEPDPDDALAASQEVSRMQIDEPDPDDQELQRIQDPVTVVCQHLQKAIQMLQAELKAIEATAALQTLFKIIRNVIEHPDELKFKRLRKANPIIQKHVANHQAALEILHTIGFREDVVYDDVGKADAYFVLKRNDPGLLWLAKSSLEACMA